MILDFPITYRNASVLCQSDCACLHQTVNIVVFFTEKTMAISTQKAEHSCKCTELSLKRKSLLADESSLVMFTSCTHLTLTRPHGYILFWWYTVFGQYRRYSYAAANRVNTWQGSRIFFGKCMSIPKQTSTALYSVTTCRSTSHW